VGEISDDVPPAPDSSGASGRRPGPDAVPASAAEEWRGQRLGLPEAGPGSLAPAGRRIGGFVVDIVLAGLVAALFTAPDLPRNWSLLAFVVEYFGFVLLFGQTPGMRLRGMRVVRVDRPARIGAGAALVRTVALALLVPALIWDADGRGLHDRLSRTAVVLA
jgi:uncharacterized RDD family membrane protein YckC